MPRCVQSAGEDETNVCSGEVGIAQRLPKLKPKKPKKHTPAPPASGDGSSGMRRRNNQYTVGRPIQGAEAPAVAAMVQVAVE